MELALTCASRMRAPPLIDALDRALDLVTSDYAKKKQIAHRWTWNYAHIGANLLLMVGKIAKRLQRNEFVNFMKIVIDRTSEPVVQAVH